MATRTSTQSGDWNDTATWGGAAAPGDGDIAVIATGHTVTVTANVTVGSNSASVGDAVEIQATNASVFGKLIVNDGVTLTLKGNDTSSNTAMEIDRYAVFEPAPGAIIEVDVTSNYETVIANAGIINAIGTLAKPIIFRGTAASANWNNSASAETKSGSNWQFDGESNHATRNTTNPWISNAAGTGIGSVGDSSVSISSQSPGTICATEVAIGPPTNPTQNVDAVGEYAIDYHTGVIYFYHVHSAGAPSFQVTYKYLTFNGWGIVSTANTTYNEAKFDHCNFEYMGGTSARQYGLENRYKKSTTSEANRLFSLTNSTVSYGRQFCAIRDFTGTSGDPILITGNRFNQCATVSFAAVLGINESAACSYVTIDDNTLDCGTFILIGSPFNTETQHVGISISGNSGSCVNFMGQRTASAFAQLYDGVIEDNNIVCCGRLGDARCFSDIAGSSGHPLVIRNNTFSRGNRLISGCQSYVVVENNMLDSFPHHWITAPVADDIYVTYWRIRNNAFYSRSVNDNDGVLETGYNHRHHVNDIECVNNTLGRGLYAILSMGDTADTNGNSLVTNLVVANNVAYEPVYGIARNAHDSDELNLHQILYLDNNLVYNPSSGQVLNYNKQATFIRSSVPYNLDGTRNVLGVALFDPLYTLPEATGRSLVLTYTSATDQTLGWGGGTPVQLVVSSGTATAGANNSNGLNGSLTDSGKSWSTNLVSGTVVRCKWVKITGGTGAGQIRAITNNTATVLTVVPAWTTPPSTDSTYSIIESEVQLFDSGATNYVRAGVYLPELPTSSQTDTGITITASNLTSDPLLVDAAGYTADDFKVSAGSPVIGAAYAAYATATDYFGVTRTTPDMGFYEFVAEGAASRTGPTFSPLQSPALPANFSPFSTSLVR